MPKKNNPPTITNRVVIEIDSTNNMVIQSTYKDMALCLSVLQVATDMVKNNITPIPTPINPEDDGC